MLNDLSEILNAGIITAVQNLQNLYNNDYRRQLYCTIIDRSIDHGLNSGNFDIRTPADAIAGLMLEMYENFIQSNQHLELNDSFKVQFKILSVEHFNHNVNNVPSFQPHIVGSHTRKVFPKYILDPPSFCSWHNYDCFRDLCFLISFLIGLIRLEYEELNKFSEFLQFRKDLFHRYAKHRKDSCRKLHDYLNQVKPLLKERSKWNDLNYCLPKLSHFYNIQIHIFDETCNFNLKESFPEKMDYKMKQMHMCLFNNSHLTLVNNLNQLFSQNKNYFCFACAKHFTRKIGLRHICKKHETCFACGRHQKQPDYYLNFINRDHFCEREGAEKMTCRACKRTCQNKSCFRHHKLICKNGMFFSCCGKFTYISGEEPSLAYIKENHRCEKKCKVCRDYLGNEDQSRHQCKFGKTELKSTKSETSYFHFVSENDSGATCYSCHINVCTRHQNSGERYEMQPAMLGLFFADSNKTMIFSKYAKAESISVDVQKVKVKRSDRISVPVLSHLRKSEYESIDLLDQFLKFIIEHQVFGHTFACLDQSGISMLYILRMFLNNGLTPFVFHHQNQIRSITLKNIKIRFINLINFLPREDWTENAIFPLHYVTRKSVKENFLPSLDEFREITDSIETISKKKAYLKSVEKSEWNFYDRLTLYVIDVLSEIFHKSKVFLSGCEEFQRLAFSVYGEPCHFHDPYSSSTTKISYFFRLFSFLELNHVNLRLMSNETTGIPFKSSREEHEYTSYLKHIHPQNDIQDCFSPYGQQRYEFLIPDAVNLTTFVAYFFNGCYWHRHNCMKKFTSQEIKTAERKFNQKKILFKKKYPQFQGIEIMWECEWRELKKHSTAVKSFLTSYVRRPMKRLRPREARTYGFIHILFNCTQKSLHTILQVQSYINHISIIHLKITLIEKSRSTISILN